MPKTHKMINLNRHVIIKIPPEIYGLNQEIFENSKKMVKKKGENKNVKKIRENHIFPPIFLICKEACLINIFTNSYDI